MDYRLHALVAGKALRLSSRTCSDEVAGQISLGQERELRRAA
jgi:predicted nucleic acid-binding Zn ribbon protein